MPTFSGLRTEAILCQLISRRIFTMNISGIQVVLGATKTPDPSIEGVPKRPRFLGTPHVER